jgi:O-acetyl-ADP-ribose deacetylase (regulator of RNase III)
MGKVKIVIGDITSDEILDNHDLIVNPTNPQMVAGAGVSGAIFKKAGVDILEKYTQGHYDINYFSDNYKIENIMTIGDVRITPGFNLNMDIMFVQGPKQWENDNSI